MQNALSKILNRFFARWQKEIRFIIAGIPSRGTYYGIYILLPIYGVHYLTAACVAFLGYWLTNFYLVRTWAFKSNKKAWKVALPHLALHITFQTFSLIGLYIFVEMYALNFIFAQCIMGTLYGFGNYFFSRLIFKHREPED